MEHFQITIGRGSVIAFMLCSVALFLIGVFQLLVHNRVLRNRMLPFENRSIWFLLCTIGATFLMRYMVGVSGAFGSESLTNGEELANSFLHTMQSFTMDESYNEYISRGKLLMTQLFPNSAFMTVFYSLYLSIVHVCCALSGGAILYALVARIFPSVRLMLMSLRFWKPICFFSATNAEALTLAKSIRDSDNTLKDAQFVFCGGDGDTESAQSECVEQAKLLGGLCLGSDLAKIRLPRNHGKHIFLIDTDERNYAALAGLIENDRLFSDDEIYRFCEDTDGFALDNMARKARQERDPKDKLLIFPLNQNQRLVYSLLMKKPLYTALTPDSNRLHVTIFGTGNIGTEMFLHTYWCGQLLDRTLCISVVSEEPEEAFKARIRSIAPDLWETADPDSELLRIYPNEETRSPVYFRFDYTQYSKNGEDLYRLLRTEKTCGRLADSDYFVVAAGTDADNIALADRINRSVSVEQSAWRKTRVPLACHVCDDGLAKIIKAAGQNDKALECFPFGMRSELYSIEEIDYQELTKRAKRTKAMHDAQNKQETDSVINYQDLVDSSRAKDGFKYDIYGYNANIARSIHTQYKAFCAGMSYEKYVHESKASLRRNNRFAWLEHRRWTAFMRIMGFRCPNAQEEAAYIGRLPDATDDRNAGKHKSVELKLHPCIVECAFGKEKKDYLDLARDRLVQQYESKHFPIDDFKKFDHPQYDF